MMNDMVCTLVKTRENLLLVKSIGFNEPLQIKNCLKNKFANEEVNNEEENT